MPVQTYNLAIKQGATFRLLVTLRQPNGTPIDLTGCTGQAQVRHSYDGQPPITMDWQFAPDRTTGQYTLIIPAAVTALMTSGKWVWDGFLAFPNGEVWTPLEGDAIVRRSALP